MSINSELIDYPVVENKQKNSTDRKTKILTVTLKLQFGKFMRKVTTAPSAPSLDCYEVVHCKMQVYHLN